MAVQPVTTVWTAGDRNGISTWDAADAVDTYAALQLKGVFADITFSVEAITGGVAVELHGSVNGIDYYQLNDLDGAAISVTADGIVEVRSAPPYFMPVNTGGSGGAMICALHHAKVFA